MKGHNDENGRSTLLEIKPVNILDLTLTIQVVKPVESTTTNEWRKACYLNVSEWSFTQIMINYDYYTTEQNKSD